MTNDAPGRCDRAAPDPGGPSPSPPAAAASRNRSSSSPSSPVTTSGRPVVGTSDRFTVRTSCDLGGAHLVLEAPASALGPDSPVDDDHPGPGPVEARNRPRRTHGPRRNRREPCLDPTRGAGRVRAAGGCRSDLVCPTPGVANQLTRKSVWAHRRADQSPAEESLTASPESLTATPAGQPILDPWASTAIRPPTERLRGRTPPCAGPLRSSIWTRP